MEQIIHSVWNRVATLLLRVHFSRTVYQLCIESKPDSPPNEGLQHNTRDAPPHQQPALNSATIPWQTCRQSPAMNHLHVIIIFDCIFQGANQQFECQPTPAQNETAEAKSSPLHYNAVHITSSQPSHYNRCPECAFYLHCKKMKHVASRT